jgi:hypothetical protein
MIEVISFFHFVEEKINIGPCLKYGVIALGKEASYIVNA